jgi:hypothetical protein
MFRTLRPGTRWLTIGLIAVTALGALGVTIAVANSPAPPITPGGYPDNRYPQPNQIGAFNHVEIGIFDPIPADMTFARTYYGMPHRETWFDSELRDAATGKQYMLSSQAVLAGDNGSLTSENWLPSALKSSPTGLVPNPVPKSWTGGAQPPTVELTPGNQLKYTVHDTATTETIVFDAHAFDWTAANGDIDLHGTLVSPGTQWLLPWREPTGKTDMWLYLTHNYLVQGTYYGQQVKGYVLLEQRWGNGFYGNTWNVQNRIGSLGWFATEYQDGTQESGFWLCGEYGSRGAAFANNSGQEILETQQINVTAKPDGHSLDMRFGDGQHWEFIYDPTASLAGINTGVMKRVGDHRKIIAAHALYIGRRVPSDGSVCRPEPFKSSDHGNDRGND